MNRRDILKKILEEHEKVVTNLKNSVERYRTASEMDEVSSQDPEDFSQQTQAKDLQLRFEKLFQLAKKDDHFILAELEKSHQEIEIGSLIETDKNWLFIGVSVPPFTYKGKTIMSFSTEAPIYSKLKKKHVSETISIGSETLKIISIY